MSEEASAPVESSEVVETAEVNESVESNESQDNEVTPDKGTKPKVQPDDGTGIRKFKVKVNGEEIEVDESELVAGYQTRKAADEKFREAAMSKKQAEEFISLLKTNPKKVLENPALGLDLRQFAEQYLYEQLEKELEEDGLTDDQKELRKYKAILEEQENQKKAQQQEEETKQAQALRDKYTQDYSKQITDALGTSGLPKSEHTVKRMAFYMHQGLQRGINVSASDVVDMVRQDYINEQKSLFGGLDADALIKILGDETANKIRKWDVSRVKGTKSQPKTPDEQGTAKVRETESKKISKDEWRKKMSLLKGE